MSAEVYDIGACLPATYNYKIVIGFSPSLIFVILIVVKSDLFLT